MQVVLGRTRVFIGEMQQLKVMEPLSYIIQLTIRHFTLEAQGGSFAWFMPLGSIETRCVQQREEF